MDVVRNCTGTYLRFNGKDFPVCNERILDNVATWTSVKATYKKVDSNDKCEGRETPRCSSLHPYPIGDWIEVIRITK